MKGPIDPRAGGAGEAGSIRRVSRRVAVKRAVQGAALSSPLWSSVAARATTEGAQGIAAPDKPFTPAPNWPERLQQALHRLDSDQAAGGRLGVWVADLGTGAQVSHRAAESWYLASMVKVPVAIALLRGADGGNYGLDTRLTLRQADIVDGSGGTKRQAVGTRLVVGQLLEQMIVWSDNTATDMLIELVGLDAVNDVAAELSGGGLGPITRLVDVRRHVYGGVDERARQLSGVDFLALRNQSDDAARLRWLAGRVGEPRSAFADRSIDAAYRRYYASGLNSGRLDAYGRLLTAVAQGTALPAGRQQQLMEVMRRVQTGRRRLRAGLPSCLPFAEKTGTQRRRICDAGIVEVAAGAGPAVRRLVVVACVRDLSSNVQAERVLRGVGAALTTSGAFDDILSSAPDCAAPSVRVHPLGGDAVDSSDDADSV